MSNPRQPIWDMARTVELAAPILIRGPVLHLKRKNSGLPIDAAFDGLHVRVHQDLMRIAAVSVRRIQWAIDRNPYRCPAVIPGTVAVPAKRARSGRSTRRSAPLPSKRHSSTRVATSENTEKLQPCASSVAPSGYHGLGQALRGARTSGAAKFGPRGSSVADCSGLTRSRCQRARW